MPKQTVQFDLRDLDLARFERRLHGMELRMSSYKQERSFGRATQHASAGDFCSVFHQEMDVLYWLALALTSDESKAEQCFVAGLGECIEGNAVFKEWARSWSRRVVIKNAIRLILPRPDVTFHPPIVRQQKTSRTAARSLWPRSHNWDRSHASSMSCLCSKATRTAIAQPSSGAHRQTWPKPA